MALRALCLLAVVLTVCAFPRNSGQNGPSSQIVEKIVSEGYPAELHQVTTEDGYILSIHRIPYGKNGSPGDRRPIVFVMHGLMGASSNFIYLGEAYGLAYNLADAGYDVWLGNARGNACSRAHVSLDPDDSQQKLDFFDFSWEEIAIIDVPTMIDYALAHTGERTLHYIGHSQGGTVFLVLNSMKPEYNEKFLSAHLLAGVGYKQHFPNAQLRAAALLTNSLYALGKSMGLVEISALDDLPISLGRSAQGRSVGYCAGDEMSRSYCEILGINSIVGDAELGSEPSGASLKQFAHYGQNIRDRTFRRWDYGILTNRRVYGSISPPVYDLSRVTVDVTMHYTVSDEILDEKDVLNMAAAMPNTKPRKIARETFTHFDFVQASDVKELVNNYIIDRLGQVELNAAQSVQEVKEHM